MKILKKTDSVFKWIILGIAIANLLSYFMPIFESIYRGDGKPELVYFYGSSSSYIAVSFTSLIIPITAIVFLFAKFKNSKLFFFGFNATYVFNSIFTILNLSKAISNNSSDYYKYNFKYGYYIYIVTIALLAIAVICSFIFYLILKCKDSNEESKQTLQSVQDEKIDVLRKRIEVLGDLKNQGILTETEYEQKRSEIIKELKI